MIRYEVLNPREFWIVEHEGLFYAEERVQAIETASKYLFWKKEKRSLEWMACGSTMSDCYTSDYMEILHRSTMKGFKSKKKLKKEMKRHLKEPVYCYDVLDKKRDSLASRLRYVLDEYGQPLKDEKKEAKSIIDTDVIRITAQGKHAVLNENGDIKFFEFDGDKWTELIDCNIRLKLDSMDYEHSLNELKSKIDDLHKQYIGKKEERIKSNNHDVTTWTHNNEDESKGISKGMFISDTTILVNDIELKNVKAAELEMHESGKWNVRIECDITTDMYYILDMKCGFKSISHNREWCGIVKVAGITSVDGVMSLGLRGVGKLRVIPEA